MRIQDRELLQAMWLNQMNRLASGVIHTYAGSAYGVVNNDNFWYESCSSEHRISRERITQKIGKQQLMKRINALVDNGHVASSYKDRLTFYIPGKQAKEAFEEARNWWMERDVPTGIVDSVCQTKSMPKEQYQAMCAECADYLRAKFPNYVA